MDTGLLFNVFIFLAAACVVVPLVAHFKLGAVLGFMIAGILIGPYGLKLIADSEKVMSFAEVGVVMMLFVIGLEVDPGRLWRLRKSILGMGGFQVALTTLAFGALGFVLGYDWRMSLAVGMALSLSSTALVLQILQEKNLLKTPLGETSFSVLLFQDIAVIPILILMSLLAGTSSGAAPVAHPSALGHLPGWMQTLAVAGAIGFVIVVGRYLSPYLFRIIARAKLRELFTATSLALVIGITLLMQVVGVSPALGVFLAGVVLANSEYRRTLEADIEPFKALLLGLFFITVGMGMDFGLLLREPFKLLAALGILVGIKTVLLFWLGKVFGLESKQRLGFAFALSQGGEFAFVLFQFAGGLQILPPELVKFLTLTVALSMATTPLLMEFYGRRLVPRFMSMLPKRDFDEILESNPIIIAGFGRVGQIIGRFLMGQGIEVTMLDNDPEQVDAIRKFGYKGYFGDAARMDTLRAAGADKAKLLVVAVDDADTALKIVELAKSEFPNLKIYARARNRRHAYDLNKAGTDYFKRETFDSSLAMAEVIMKFLGGKPEEIHVKAEKFREHDEASLRKSFEFFEDEPALVDFARLSRNELDQVLRGDIREKE
ncbi:MAG TPA: monovalent cation:proton antiporter-2 (CPA2) family protein [bacterium]|nr:monovalent cation:proton antiporter-2 (CPA2) family protein [bacterium]